MNYSCPRPQPVKLGDAPSYNGDPDLLLLREDLAEETGSIIGYFECSGLARDYRVGKVFRRIANDELGHFAALLQLITGIDAAQAEELKRQDLQIMAIGGDEICPYHPDDQRNTRAEQKRVYADDPVWDFLQNAIKDELLAINAYQRQVGIAVAPAVQGLLINIMNKEKEHFVTFTKLFYELYGLRRDWTVLTD